jgi:hypothetical protein
MEITFSDKIKVGSVALVKAITEADVENIMVGAIEGGINEWGYILPISKKGKPADEPTSTWCARLILDGGEVFIGDIEDDEEKWVLTKNGLMKGIQDNITKRSSTDMEQYDADDYDCIIQYALFDKLVFG